MTMISEPPVLTVKPRGKLAAVGLWALTALLAFAFVASGLMKFLSPQAAEAFAQFGFPDWFRPLIGGLEIAGGLGLLLPRLSYWAAWGLGTIMVGAALTHAYAREGNKAVVPLVLLALLGLVGYARRPRAGEAAAGRRTRWWIAGLVVMVAGAHLGYVLVCEQLETPFRNMGLIGTAVLGVLLLTVWFVFLTGLRWRTRLLAPALLAAAGFGMSRYCEFSGSVNGAGMPRLVWKGTPPPDAGLAAPTVDAQAVAGLAAGKEDYPRFLGSDRNGVVRGVRLDPDWSAHPPDKLWRQRIGAGWSAFAVVGDAAFTQEQRGDQELVVCYDLKTGHVRWRHADPVRLTDKQGGDGPRATPTVTGGRVYTMGGTGILNCLDGATGKRLWSHDTLKENGLPNLIWGKSCSPLVVDDLVVVNGGLAQGPALLAYKKDGGELAWKAGDDKSSYSSPALATLAGRRQILTVNAGSVTGHDIKDGHVLWEYKWPGEWAKVSQPVALEGDRVFLSAGYGLGCVMLHVEDRGDRMEAAELWKNLNLKTTFSNVVVRDGFAYGLDDGVLACVDLATGARKWKGDRYGYGQVLLVGDLIVVQAEKGAVVLVEATPSGHHRRARFAALDRTTWNNPVLAGPYLLVRNDREAACYKLPTVGEK